ncbi:MAG TPA: hypothetical protein VMS64_18130 [Candidatus Methylomirabilis sp.]|nr:hypothetical protein [Candidatus Methylomirabilis sp.]
MTSRRSVACGFLVALVSTALAGCATLDLPPKSPTKTPATCYAAGPTPAPPGPPVILDNTVSGGTFLIPGAGVAPGTVINLTSDLVIISTGDVEIGGQIRNPQNKATSIIIVSLEGNIVVQPTALIGFGTGETPQPVVETGATPFALGAPGGHGGVVKLVAEKGSIVVYGNIRGQMGGSGSRAEATSDPVVAAAAKLAGRSFAGWAIAVGGQGGPGGDVILCALEAIAVGSFPGFPGGATVQGGQAGAPGRADATGAIDGFALALGGYRYFEKDYPGHVYIESVAPPGSGKVQLFVNPGGLLQGADGTYGQDGEAAVAGSDGGSAMAIGGDASPGGSVFFGDVIVFNRVLGRAIAAGDGAQGGDGSAEGATGPDGAAGQNGKQGGSASAFGGGGSKAGATPVYLDGLLNPPALALGSAGTDKGGGDAKATGGNGGAAGSGGASGGSSGDSRALGGANAAGQAPQAPDQKPSNPPNPANPTQGGAGQQASQTGVP